MRQFSFGKIATIAAIIMPSVAGAQLAGGTYTINSGAPASSTNYTSLGAAVTAMAPGISGPVVFNVVAGSGPYTEQVTIGSITGASATNTIRINGNGATVQFNATANFQGTLMLNGAKFLKIDSLTFKTMNATYGFGANIYNSCNTDTITRCIFDITSVTGIVPSASMGLRVGSAAAASSSAANGASNLYFAYNKILGSTTDNGMYYGINIYGNGTNNVIANNQISNFYNIGIYTYYGQAKLLNNTITRETKTTTAYCYALSSNYAAAGSVVSGNKIYSLGGATTSTGYCYPLYFSNAAGTAASPVMVYNNIVYNTTSIPSYGLYSSNCVYANFYHNSIAIDVPVNYPTATYGIYLSGGTNCNFKNNNLSITGGGTSAKYGYYLFGYTGNNLERNNIYVNSTQAGTQYYANVYGGSSYNTLAAFQAAYPNHEAGSTSVNPGFMNSATGNLVPTNMAMFGKGVNLQTSVPTDFNGVARLATPAPGAFEFQATGMNNAGSVNLVEPLGRYCSGDVPVKATIYNGGTNNITSVKVNWSLNGVVQTPVTYNATTLYPLGSTSGAPTATVTLGNAPLQAGVSTGIKIWTSMPNGVADAINSNDTVSDTLKAVKLMLTVMNDTICINRSAVMPLTPGAGYNTGALQWELSSNNGGAWTPVPNSDITSYVTPNLAADVWYRVKMTSAPNNCYSDTAKIYTADPQLLSYTQYTERCGPGTVTLLGQAPANTLVKWFDDPNSTTPVATGTSFVTPYLTADDTFYVSAGTSDVQPANALNVVPLGPGGFNTTSSANSMPFYGLASSSRQDYIIPAQNLTSLGFTAGNINSVGLRLNAVGTPNIGTVNISLKLMPQTYTTAPNTYLTGMQNVFTQANVVLQPNAINTFSFQTPFYWDGVSNIVISFCNTGATNTTSFNSYNCVFNTSYYRTTFGSGSSSMCASTATVSTTYLMPHMYFKMTNGCETNKIAIPVTIRPVPVVDLGPDMNKCVDSGYVETLDAGVQPNNPQFLWDDGSTSQVRAVGSSGIYSVKVTNQYNCSNSDTVRIVLRNNPVVDLGNDTSVCNGVTLNLNAGNNGATYFWNTGQTTQSITINNAGIYSVFVTNGEGCTKADSIVVNMDGELPGIQGIQVTNNGKYTFHFTAANPQNVVGYDWDFGDGSAHSYQPDPIHTYPNEGNYIVVLRLSSSCGFFSDSSSAHILGINQLDVANDEMMVYPNPAKESATILNKGALKMESIAVYNVLGQVVYKANADSQSKHVLNVNNFASGVYTIQIFTDKGTVSRKVEIMK